MVRTFWVQNHCPHLQKPTYISLEPSNFARFPDVLHFPWSFMSTTPTVITGSISLSVMQKAQFLNVKQVKIQYISLAKESTSSHLTENGAIFPWCAILVGCCQLVLLSDFEFFYQSFSMNPIVFYN